jgi:flagellar M-ring protein FliF
VKKNSPQEYLESLKKYFSEMPPEKKKKLGIGVGAVVAFAAVVAILLNIGKLNYKVLYSGLNSAEASTVYSQLQEMGVSPSMDKNGDIKVPSDKYDQCLLQLAQSGLPQSALTYDLFSDHAGLTSTETEKKQWIIYQLQDRIQNTLKQIDGVQSSTVTINIPDTSDYIWDQATETSDSTAGVLLTLRAGTQLSTSQITAIKNLVASSTPKMSPENVTVVDANTMLELAGDNDGDTSSASMECEQLAQRQIEENIVRLLTPRYGSGGVVAVAKVKLNYDKMMTEKMELLPQPTASDGTGGGGYTTHNEGSYTLNGAATAGDVVGEENNTDIPTYAYNETGKDNSLTDYSWSKDTDYGYIKTQIEKGNAVIDSATVSVLVNDTGLSKTEKDELVSLVSKSANIDEADIYVSTFEKTTDTEQNVPASTQPIALNIPWLIVAAVAAGVVLILVLISVLLHRRKNAKKRAEQNEKERLAQEESERRKKMEQEIASYKKQLADAASAGMDEKNEAIVKDVRDFAKENPAIAANLLRSWLREGDS